MSFTISYVFYNVAGLLQKGMFVQLHFLQRTALVQNYRFHHKQRKELIFNWQKYQFVKCNWFKDCRIITLKIRYSLLIFVIHLAHIMQFVCNSAHQIPNQEPIRTGTKGAHNETYFPQIIIGLVKHICTLGWRNLFWWWDETNWKTPMERSSPAMRTRKP